MSLNKVPTISSSIDEDSRNSPFRHSLQPKSTTEPVDLQVKRHNSLGKSRQTNFVKKPTVPVIPEAEKSDDETPNLEKQDAASSESVRVSFTKTNRKISNISKTSKASIQSVVTPTAVSSMERGFVNYGYDQSSSASLHGSMSSLPVIREQYCCCARWTRLEKNLAFIVAILALVIIGLVIAIGIVANETNNPNSRFPFVFHM